MSAGQFPQISILFAGEPGSRPASIMHDVADNIADLELTTVGSLQSALNDVEPDRFDCLVYGDSAFESGDTDTFQELRQSADRRPHILLQDHQHASTERALKERVSEVIPLDLLDEPHTVVLDRLEFHVGRYRQGRRHRALWYQVRQVINQAEDIVWMFSEEWDELLFANAAYEDIFGQDLEELYARPKSFLEAIHPTDRPKVRRAMDRLSAGEEVELEYRVNRGGDYNRWVWVIGYPITNDTGEMMAVSGFCRDISERKTQEQRFRRERDRFLRLFEHFPEPTLAYRFDGDIPRVAAVNESFERIFGYSAEESIGEDIDELVAPEDRREEATRLDERVRAGEFVDAEVIRLTTNGERHFRFRNIELPEDDEFDGFAIYADIHDRTQREQTLNALHETSRKLARARGRESIADISVEAVENIIELPWAGMWLSEDDEYTPVTLTDEFEHALEVEPVISRETAFGDTLERQGELQFEDTRDADFWPTSLTPVQCALILSLGEHGFLLFGAAEPGDISEEHHTFARILAANTEAAIERADREVTLRRQRQELQRQNERLEEFTSVVSHDLRTPLAVASAATEQLSIENENLDVDKIENALERMDDIISKTLTLARSGQVTGETEPVDLSSLAMRCRHTVSASEMDLEIDDGLPTIEADPDRLQHVFENLYRNAVEHAGPEVTITVERTEDGFAVSDDGPGISEDEVERIFETGYSTTAEGTGFGLAIVKRIAEAHDWSIYVDKGPAGGAQFRFSSIF